MKTSKKDKATREYNNLAEAIKEDGEAVVAQQDRLLSQARTTGEIPMDWKKGLLVKLPKSGDPPNHCR